MGIDPVRATQKLKARLGLTIGDLDALELNEAFARPSLAVMCALGLPADAPHVNGAAPSRLATRSACRARESR